MKIKKIYDISRNIAEDTTVWPGDPATLIKKIYSFENGDGVNAGAIKMGMHTGTHVDAPLHYIKNGKSVDELDLSYFVGCAKVFDTYLELISLEYVRGLDIEKGDIILFKTSNSKISDNEQFREDYVALSFEAAEFLAEKKVKTIGIDYLSIESYSDKNGAVHKLLLEKEIALIESLNLKDVKEGRYFLSCLPLKIRGAEASPVRAVLIEM